MNSKQHDWAALKMLHFSGFVICFLIKTLIFHQWFSIYNLGLNTRWMKKEMLCKIISLPMRQTFFLEMADFTDFYNKLIFDLKRNRRLLDNKSWESRCTTVSCMDQWLWGYVELVSWRIKNNKTKNYIQKCNERPFHEKKKERNKIINITIVESTKCLSRYKAKLKFCSHSQQLKQIHKNDS